MAKSDIFRQAFEAGATFVDLTRERAEVVVKDLVKAGAVSRGKAQKLIDELLERSRQGTEELRALIRREVADLGLATTDDIARVEARLDLMATATDLGAPAPAAKGPAAPVAGESAGSGAAAKRVAPARVAPSSAEGPAKAPAAKKATAKKATAERATAAEKAAPAQKAAPAKKAASPKRASAARTAATTKAAGATASKGGTRETRGSEGPGTG